MSFYHTLCVLTSCVERPQTWSDSGSKTKQMRGELWCLWMLQRSGKRWNFPEWLEWKPVATTTALPPRCGASQPLQHNTKEGDRKTQKTKQNHEQFKNTTATVRDVSPCGNNSDLMQLEGSSQQPTGATAWDQLDLLTTLGFFEGTRQLKESRWSWSTNKCFPLALTKKVSLLKRE